MKTVTTKAGFLRILQSDLRRLNVWVVVCPWGHCLQLCLSNSSLYVPLSHSAQKCSWVTSMWKPVGHPIKDHHNNTSVSLKKCNLFQSKNWYNNSRNQFVAVKLILILILLFCTCNSDTILSNQISSLPFKLNVSIIPSQQTYNNFIIYCFISSYFFLLQFQFQNLNF